VSLFTQRGLDWTDRYPSIAAAVAALSCRSCLIDGEVVICGEDGVPVFDRLRYGRRPPTEAVLFAFRPARIRRQGFAAGAARDAQTRTRQAAPQSRMGAAFQ
jgi:hypothetical protein